MNDKIHLTDQSTNIPAGNLAYFVTNFIIYNQGSLK